MSNRSLAKPLLPMKAGRHKRSIRLQIAALLAVFGLLFAACAGGSDSSTASFAEVSDAVDGGGDAEAPAATEAMEEDAPEEEAMEDNGAMEAPDSGDADSDLGTGGSSSGENVNALQPLDIGRDIIFTADISVEVDHVGDAANEAMNEISALGGLLFGQQTSTDGRNRTTLTFRVRPADFQEAVSRLGGIGELRDQNISSEDVTGRVVDLQSQIITAEASVERLREFLTGAVGLEDVARLEAQLLDRETVLERLRGQLRTVQDRVDLATITVSLVERIPGPAIEVVQTAYKGSDEGVSCQGDTKLTVDEDEAFTICLVVTNRGDTHLTDFEIRDEGFGIENTDVFTDDDLDGILAPGETIKAYFVVTSKGFSTPLQTAVAAAVVDAEGNDIGEARVGARGNAALTVRPNEALPGFVDALKSGWGVLQSMIGVVVYLAGLLLPFFWVPILAWVGLRFIRRANNNRPVVEEPTPTPVQPAG